MPIREDLSPLHAPNQLNYFYPTQAQEGHSLSNLPQIYPPLYTGRKHYSFQFHAFTKYPHRLILVVGLGRTPYGGIHPLQCGPDTN